MITISFAIWYCIPLLTIAFLYTRIGMVLWSTSLKPLEIRYSNGRSFGTFLRCENRTLRSVDVINQHFLGTTHSDSNGNGYLTINYDSHHNGNGAVADSNGTQKLLDEKRSIANSDVLESRKKVSLD